MTRESEICVLPHHYEPDRPRRAKDGLRVCIGHVAKLTRQLDRMAPLHTALGNRLANAGDPAPMVSGSRDPGIKVSDPILLCRKAIRRKLTGWVVIVADEIGVTMPTLSDAAPTMRRGKKLWRVQTATGIEVVTLPTATVTPASEVRVLTDWLATWHEWLLAREDCAGSWAQDLADLEAEALRLAYPSGIRRAEVGPCPHENCGGTLTAVVRATDSLLPSAITCGDDETHTWPSSRWLRLAPLINRAAS